VNARLNGCRLTLVMLLVHCAIASAEEPRSPITAITVSPVSGDLLTGSQSGLSDRRYQSRLSHIHDLAFSPNGRVLAVAGGVPGENGVVELFDVPPSGQPQFRFRNTLHSDVAYCVSWSPNGRRIVTASLDAQCKVLDVSNGQLISQLAGHSRGVTSACFLTDDLLVTASLDDSIRVWRLPPTSNASNTGVVVSGALVRTLSNHTAPVSALALRPVPRPNVQLATELSMIASISEDRSVRFWQPTIGRMVRFARLNSVPLSSVWLRNGERLAVGSRDGSIRLINPDTAEVGKPIATLTAAPMSLAVSLDGHQLLVGTSDGVLHRLPM
jgi:WD40 repeat protein